MNAEQLFENFHLIRPWFLLAIPIVAALWFTLWKMDKQSTAEPTIVAPHLASALLMPAGNKGWLTPLTCMHLLAGFLALALSGPTWERQSSPLIEDEAILIIALDLSQSMQQADVQPSRVERAKQKIQDLLALRAGARSGLIAYAGSAHSVIPITSDLDIVQNFLSAIRPDMMPRSGKLAAKVLPVVDSMFSQTVGGRKDIPGTLLLITDNADSATQEAFSTFFQQSKHQLVVWGVGTTDFTDSSNAQVPANFIAQDEAALKELASNSDGFYQAFSTDKSDVRRINWQIDNYLLTVDDNDHPWVDKGYVLLLPIMLLCLLWFRRGWTVQYLLVLATLSIGSTAFSPISLANDKQQVAIQDPTEILQSTTGPLLTEPSLAQRFVSLWFTADQRARFYFERGHYHLAAELFEVPMWRGIAYYLAEDFANAADAFSLIETSDGWFNLGNAWAHGQHYLKAVSAYDEVLRRRPDHPGAVKNRALIQKLIDDINRMSESQQAEPGESSRELGSEPQRADGAEQQQWGVNEQEQFNAEQLLTDERIQQQWMKQVQQDPARFLSIKFQMQLYQSGSPINSQVRPDEN
ncbi:MAG: VWA domain-containing protein [Pseudomonadales bacterium]